MADYYPLIARAVAGLDKNTGENRRALYERARAALVNQLRGVEPALDESDITRERLALEEAIRKVEAEAAKRARGRTFTRTMLPRPSLRDQGLRDFRETVAEAEGLGGRRGAGQARGARDLRGDAGDAPSRATVEHPTSAEREPPVSEPPASSETPPHQSSYAPPSLGVRHAYDDEERLHAARCAHTAASSNWRSSR